MFQKLFFLLFALQSDTSIAKWHRSLLHVHYIQSLNLVKLILTTNESCSPVARKRRVRANTSPADIACRMLVSWYVIWDPTSLNSSSNVAISIRKKICSLHYLIAAVLAPVGDMHQKRSISDALPYTHSLISMGSTRSP